MDSAQTAKLLPTLLFSLVKHGEQSSCYLLDMVAFLKATGLPITMNLELSRTIQGQHQVGNVFFLKLLWGEQVGKLTSYLWIGPISSCGESQGDQRACKVAAAIEAGM